MKKSILMILACIFILPFTARSQNDGIKAASNPKPVEHSLVSPINIQEMSLLQEQGTSGGGACPTGISAANTGMYLEPGWTPGSVIMNDRSALVNLLLRYDIYNQQLQFIMDNDTMAFAKPEEIALFHMGDKKLIYTDFQKNGIIGKGYFEILSDGKCKLLLRRTIKYHYSPDDNPNITDDVYINESEYYIMKNEDMVRPLSACRKSVLFALQDKEEQVKGFIEDHDLKMNTCDQLKKVVAYYNSLF